ncbi:MAG: T9SS type A sorting domain-containing protein [Cytophagaceae bacterium]
MPKCLSTTTSVLVIFVLIYGNSFSQVNWAFSFQGSSGTAVEKITQDSAGDIVITGGFTGNGADFDPSTKSHILNTKGGQDIFIAKYDINKNLKWALGIGGTYNDLVHGLATDLEGNVYICGSFLSDIAFAEEGTPGSYFNDSGTHGFFAKYNKDGIFQWASVFEGGTSDCYGITLDLFNNIYLTGKIQNTVDLDPTSSAGELKSIGGSDIFVAMFFANGKYNWGFRVGSNAAYYGYTYNESGHDIKFCNGFLYVTGSFAGLTEFNPNPGTSYKRGSKGQLDPFLAKYDILGNIQWVVNIAASTSSDNAYALDLDKDENVYITGGIYYSADFDASENIATISTNGGQDIFVAKYDKDGHYKWAFAAGGPNFDEYGLGISINNKGDLFLTGTYHGVSDFDPSPDHNTATGSSTMYGQIFVARYDTAMVFKWVIDIGLKAYAVYNHDIGKCIYGNDDGVVFVTGSFIKDADFDPSSNSYLLTSNDRINGFVASYDANSIQMPSGVNSNQQQFSFGLYPNPTNGILYIENISEVKSIFVCDHLGRAYSIVFENYGEGIRITDSNLPPGIYFISVNLQDGRKGLERFVKL